ncbi:MAG TPA: hypothetical protein VEO91_08495 [Candidatus Limnocylindria bacterium]|nr:hypothetical protein [Candidatus Limnocylindria bacterium]
MAIAADVGPVLAAEVDFVLPTGYRDAAGTVHREGRMRLATARDELTPLVDSRVARNRAYLVVLLLSRVVTRLGALAEVTPEVVEGLYATDFAYLQSLYRRLNMDPLARPAACPHCGKPIAQEVAGLGGAVATPPD